MHSHLAFKSSCAALLAVLATFSVHAETWNYRTQLSLSSDWNDNPALVDDSLNPQSTFRFLAIYDGEFERSGYDTILNFRPRLTTDYYPDSEFSKLQSTDYFLPGSFSYQRPTSVWALGFNASQQSVLSSDALTSQGVTVGLLESDDTLTQLGLSPSLLWQLSERDELNFGLSYSVNDYDLDTTSRADSTAIGANISYRRSLSERHTVGVSTFLSSTDSDRKAVNVDGRIKTNSDSSFITADYSYAISTTSSLSISYGLQQATTKTSGRIDSPNVSGNTGSLDFNSTTYNVAYLSEGPRSKFSIGASRSVTLDIANGQPQDRYDVTFDSEYKLTERLTGGWGITAWQQEAIALEVRDENNQRIDIQSKPKYANTEVRLSWNLTRKWYLTGRYEYRWRSDDQRLGNRDFNLRAVSNNISLGVTYLWKEFQR